MDDYETLFRRHAPALLRFAWGLCGNRSEAEDIVSETFVRLLTRAPRIRTRTALAYLMVAARNVYLTGLRRRRRDVALSEDMADHAVDPGTRMDDRATLDSVLRALGDLPEGERSALLLRVDHELRYEEIAAVLGTTVGAAKVRVHRARLRLAAARRTQEERR